MAKPTPEQIAARSRALAGVEMEEADAQFPELGGQGKKEPEHFETGKPENRETVTTQPAESDKRPPQPTATAGERPKTPRKGQTRNAQPASPAAAAPREAAAKPVTITISIPQPDARRSRDLENHIYDNRDTIGLKGKIGPSLIFKMGLDLLESLSEEELFSYARKNATYQQ